MKGKTKHPLYRTWSNMISRCEIPGSSSYKNYGAKGVSVCREWRMDFWSFADSMGLKPSRTHSIDRIDPTGNYEPSNCRWATLTEQARNSRSARYIEIEGKMVHVSELSEKTGIDAKTLYWRNQQGWPLDQVMNPEYQWDNVESQAKAQVAAAAKRKSQTHCKNGHELSGPNLYSHKGRRHCRKCRRQNDRNIRSKHTPD